MFNVEKGTITLQEIVDRILLKNGLQNMLAVLILALAVCVRVRGCAEKSHTN